MTDEPTYHPLVDRLLRCFERHSAADPARDALAEVDRAALRIADGAELHRLVRDTLLLAAFASERQASEAAEALLQLADRWAHRLEMLALHDKRRLEEGALAAQKGADRDRGAPPPSDLGAAPSAGVSLRPKKPPRS